MKNKNLNIRIDEKLLQDSMKFAQQYNMTFSNLVRQLLINEVYKFDDSVKKIEFVHSDQPGAIIL